MVVVGILSFPCSIDTINDRTCATPSNRDNPTFLPVHLRSFKVLSFLLQVAFNVTRPFVYSLSLTGKLSCSMPWFYTTTTATGASAYFIAVVPLLV